MVGTQEPYSRLTSPSNQEDSSATNDATQESQASQQQGEKPRYKYKNILYKLGVAEVTIGGLSILLTIVSLIVASQYHTYQYSFRYYGLNETSIYTHSYHHGMTEASSGIWCGVILLASGILGMKAKIRPSVCMYNANMTLSIVAATFMLPFIVISGVAAGNNMSYYRAENRIYSLVVIHTILAILAFAAGVICIIHSAYCCAGVCCRRKSHQGVVAYYPQPHGVQQSYQMVQLQNGQYVMVPHQPMVSSSFPVAPMYQSVTGYAVMPQAGVAPPPSSGAPVVPQPPQGGMVPPVTQVAPQVNLYPAVASATKETPPSDQPVS